MPFGISPAGEIFQRRLDQAIEGLDGVKTVGDDILVIGNGATTAEAVKEHGTNGCSSLAVQRQGNHPK